MNSVQSISRWLALVGGSVRRCRARSLLALDRVKAWERELLPQSDDDLRQRGLSLRYRARSGEPPGDLLPETFALVREAARRTIGLRHFDVQILGGALLFHGAVAEMETGEGKTLTATLPLTLRALSGRGAHLATVNDYLARRDAEWMGPVYRMLGLTVGVIEAPMSADERRRAYACDITYGTANEFGFDFLRDRLAGRQRIEQPHHPPRPPLMKAGSVRGDESGSPVQRGMHFALVDEADSILIDEARTPLVLSTAAGPVSEQRAACYRWSAAVAERFEAGRHYAVHARREVWLTTAGRELVRGLARPPGLDRVELLDLYEAVERAIRVRRDFARDRDYVVRNGEVVIVDEFTGRLAEGRKWRDGMHQAIEAREGLDITLEIDPAARITVQDLFLRYEHLAGMTGTASGSAGELRKVYGLTVVPVPTNRPVRRQEWPPRVFVTADEKWAAVVEEVCQVTAAGRPVLIGTRSIDKSEHLSRLLTAAGTAHQVLNARHLAAEAAIVARAGEPGRVTVATNMAGRGTDIRLEPGVGEAGGLHVIGTELHEASRIDRQLAGRGGRQGDAGTFRQFLSLEDDILTSGLGPPRAERLKEWGRGLNGSLDRLVRWFRRAQRRLEQRHFRERRNLLYVERQRQQLQREMGLDPYLNAPE